MTESIKVFLLLCCSLLGIGVLACMVRAFRGPRFTDRVVAINMIGTITIVIMALLSVALDAEYLVDISIVYALLSFIAVVVLTRLVIIRRRGQIERETGRKPEEILIGEVGIDE